MICCSLEKLWCRAMSSVRHFGGLAAQCVLPMSPVRRQDTDHRVSMVALVDTSLRCAIPWPWPPERPSSAKLYAVSSAKLSAVSSATTFPNKPFHWFLSRRGPYLPSSQRTTLISIGVSGPRTWCCSLGVVDVFLSHSSLCWSLTCFPLSETFFIYPFTCVHSHAFGKVNTILLNLLRELDHKKKDPGHVA